MGKFSITKKELQTCGKKIVVCLEITPFYCYFIRKVLCKAVIRLDLNKLDHPFCRGEAVVTKRQRDSLFVKIKTMVDLSKDKRDIKTLTEREAK